MAKKRTSKEVKEEGHECCHHHSFPTFGVILLVVGIVWITEHYMNVDLPLVAILLVVIGLIIVMHHTSKK